MTSATAPIDALALQSILARHLPLYKAKVPQYQATMLDGLSEVWKGPCDRLLDVGAGTGVMAEAIQHLFSVNKIHAIDVVDRFCPDLTVETACYDGKTVPFADGAFDAATLNNVVHHVPVDERVSLLREVRRVVDGPLYIKDHVSTGTLDDLRLALLDAIGNIPFGGMVKARYLSSAEWRELSAESGWRIGAMAAPRAYRSAVYAVLFPNRLETTMRFDPV
jgi:SAM-dependent methyltransferase